MAQACWVVSHKPRNFTGIHPPSMLFDQEAQALFRTESMHVSSLCESSNWLIDPTPIMRNVTVASATQRGNRENAVTPRQRRLATCLTPRRFGRDVAHHTLSPTPGTARGLTPLRKCTAISHTSIHKATWSRTAVQPLSLNTSDRVSVAAPIPKHEVTLSLASSARQAHPTARLAGATPRDGETPIPCVERDDDNANDLTPVFTMVLADGVAQTPVTFRSASPSPEFRLLQPIAVMPVIEVCVPLERHDSWRPLVELVPFYLEEDPR